MATAPKRPINTRWLAFWLTIGVLIAVGELVSGLLRGAGDMLSESVWWLYGEPLELRWWLLGCTATALFWWTPLHFMWRDSFGPRELLLLEVAAVTVAVAGYMFTH